MVVNKVTDADQGFCDELGLTHEVIGCLPFSEEVRRADLDGQIASRRQEVVRADRAIKSLEKLTEKQQAEFVCHQERVEARALEETWQASHAGERDAQRICTRDGR